MRRILALAFASALAVAAAADVGAYTTGIPSGGLPSANDYSATLLPERAGVVSWRTLAQVQPVKQGGKIVPEFSKDILSLDRKTVKVQGFIIPLDMGDKQKRFLLTAVPPHCSFCLPAGPDAVVEVEAKTAVKYGLEPIVVEGRFTVLKDDPSGVLYRLADAESLGPAAAAPAAGAPSAATSPMPPASVLRLPAPTK
ncbi:MAG TPA: DUF3299 domain-containing protein [Casimicrobiaceae bacterium]|jgi:hypothetical protein|nr:DUF3299 domain-containing protein [Casimicrobiaceae bacterium]